MVRPRAHEADVRGGVGRDHVEPRIGHESGDQWCTADHQVGPGRMVRTGTLFSMMSLATAVRCRFRLRA
jgi:hypothetical protein